MSVSHAFGVKLRCIFANTAKGYGCNTTEVFKKDAGISTVIGEHTSKLNSSQLSYAYSKQKTNKLEIEKLRKEADESSEKLDENSEHHKNTKNLNDTIFAMEKDDEELNEEINEKAQEIEKLSLELLSLKDELEESFLTISNLTEMLSDLNETETYDYIAEVVKEKVSCSEQLKDFQQFSDEINETVIAQKAFIDELLTSATITNQILYEKDAVITNLTSLHNHSIKNFGDDVEHDELKSKLSLCTEQVRQLNAVTVRNDSTTDDGHDSNIDAFTSSHYVISKIELDEIGPTTGHHLDEMRLLLGVGDVTENVLNKAHDSATTNEATTENHDNVESSTEAMTISTIDLTNYDEEYDDEGGSKTLFKENFAERSIFTSTASDDSMKYLNEGSSSERTPVVQSDETSGSRDKNHNRNFCNNLTLADVQRLTEKIANWSNNLSSTINLNQNLTSEVLLLNGILHETHQGTRTPSTLPQNSTKLSSKIIQLEEEVDDIKRLVYLLSAFLFISILFCILLIAKLCVKPQRLMQVSGIEMNHGRGQGRISMTSKV